MNKAVQRIFSEVPATYEVVNHVLTGGLDILWRRKGVRIAVRDGGRRWIDLCTGTGETASYLRRLAPEGAVVVGADFSLPMLSEAVKKPEGKRIPPVIADVGNLPFRSGSFDVATISFATRNINLSRTRLTATFREFRRILVPGGRFINIETSQPPNRFIRRIVHAYIALFVKPLGMLISGSRQGYGYLASTIPRFYGADELADILRDAGFGEVSYIRMTLGVAAVHRAVKSDGESTPGSRVINR